MRLDKILENIKSAETAVSEKTAAAVTHGVPRGQLMAALHEASGTKTASSALPSPADDLMKIAADVAATEQEMALKEAQFLGRAFADSVVSRVGEWQAAAGSVKTASVIPQYSDAGGFDKFASDHAELIKEAAEIGYAQAHQDLEKFAAEEYERGYSDTLQQVQHAAANEFAKAAHVTANVLHAISQG